MPRAKCEFSYFTKHARGSLNEADESSLTFHPWSASLYASSKLTSRLTGPWSVVIPKGTVFIGHKIPDTDAICSAIAASELFKGYPAKAGKLNTETEYVLQRFGVAEPDLFEDVSRSRGDSSICLVDHNQMSQVSDGVDLKKVIGVIDHHAFQSGTICTPFPIYTDIRPWGSACTIIAHAYIQHRHPLSKSSAGLMLAGMVLRGRAAMTR